MAYNTPHHESKMELAKEFDLKKIESEIGEYLQTIDLQKMISESDKPGRMRFIEGPPTMNGVPHAGHLRGRVIKDFWYRYKTLQGNKIEFNAGWDTQGLPVELQAEKELGITGGKTKVIKEIGIEKLVSECKKLVKKYNKNWTQVDNLLAMSLDQKKAYWTFKDEFIEREWLILKKAKENKILEQDYTVIAYCPSCQTSLSHAEVNQGYQEVKDPSLYYKVKLRDEDAYLIVWTTMPFTLITDAMVGLNPDEQYDYVKVKKETWIVGRTRIKEFFEEINIEEYTVEKTAKGSEFEGKKYVHPLLNEIPKLAKCAEASNYHVAVSEKFVDASTGSGLVHLSPANGEEDIKIANKRGVEIFSPIDDEVKFTADAGEKYKEMFVRDADKYIVDDLKEKNALVKIGKIKHKYPLCWRSQHPIIWLARRGWFYKIDKLGDKVIDAAKSVEYFYEQPKNRFLAIIKEKHPWCISRERIWGCPLPVWVCSDCQKHTWCFSKKEIIESAHTLPDGENFELHRPWIDNIVLRCKECGGTNTQREQYVLDTWHNSGASPFASLSDDAYKNEIPAPFFTEGIDQTRGWAYTLLVENVILNNEAVSPYKSFLFQGHVLDEKGNKMSKSQGNVIDAYDLLTQHPVDLVRFYFVWKSSPIEPLNFDIKEMMSRPYQIASTLYHLHLYYTQNSRYDKFDAGAVTVKWAKDRDLLTSADVWLLSKLQRLIKDTTHLGDTCRLHESARAIEDFVINLLSQIYIPITRGELWDEDDSNRDRRYTIYAVLHIVLKTLDVLIHPLCPYTSEYLYQCTFGEKRSILLEEWPRPHDELVNDSVEEAFDLMKECVSVSAAARMKAKLKRRWPLNEAIIVCLQKGQKEKIESLSSLLISQLNVEKYTIHELDDNNNDDGLKQLLQMKNKKLPVVATVTLERKQIGPKAKQFMPDLVKKYQETDHEKIVASLEEKSQYTFELKEDITLDREDFVVSFDASQGYALSKRDDIIVIISTARNKEMITKGLVKDVARRIQMIRKQKGYNPTDVLETASILDLDEESKQMLQEKAEEMATLVRAKKVEFSKTCSDYTEDDIDGKKIRIGIK